MDASHPPKLNGASWLQSRATQSVFKALADAGFAARVVGGAVRNALLGKPVTDVDLATTARPEQVISAAAAADLKSVPTGIAHGTVTVIADGRSYEVTTLRKDIETHGRHATVAFTDDWAADAKRRDFTLNALYCDAGGEIFDPLGGYPDLATRRVRFIGDAAERIREDYLRILRFFRFTAQYSEGAADAYGLAACVRERGGLAQLSAERVRQEMLRLLAAPRAADLIETMLSYGLITLVLPAAPRPALLRRFAGLEAALSLPPDPILRLAALTVEVPEDALRLGLRWRLSNEETGRLLASARRYPGLDPELPVQAARAILYADGPETYRERVLIAWARSGVSPSHAGWHGLFLLPEHWQAPIFPIGGEDIMAAGVPAGPRVGAILNELKAWWIAGDFSAGEAELKAKLGELVASG